MMALQIRLSLGFFFAYRGWEIEERYMLIVIVTVALSMLTGWNGSNPMQALNRFKHAPLIFLFLCWG